MPCLLTAKSIQLIDEDAFIIASKLIGEAIREKLGSKEGVLKGLEKLSSNFESPNLERLVGVAG